MLEVGWAPFSGNREPNWMAMKGLTEEVLVGNRKKCDSGAELAGLAVFLWACRLAWS